MTFFQQGYFTGIHEKVGLLPGECRSREAVRIPSPMPGLFLGTRSGFRTASKSGKTLLTVTQFPENQRGRHAESEQLFPPCLVNPGDGSLACVLTSLSPHTPKVEEVRLSHQMHSPVWSFHHGRRGWFFPARGSCPPATARTLSRKREENLAFSPLQI